MEDKYLPQEKEIAFILIPSFNWLEDEDGENPDENLKLLQSTDLFLSNEVFQDLAQIYLSQKRQEKLRKYQEEIEKVQILLNEKQNNLGSIYIIKHVLFPKGKWQRFLLNEFIFPDLNYLAWNNIITFLSDGSKIRSHNRRQIQSLWKKEREKINLVLFHYNDRQIIKTLFPVIERKEQFSKHIPIFYIKI